MKIELQKEGNTENKVRFKLSESNYTFANALRRTILGDLPSMAIFKSTIYDNSSFLYDEFLMKRLALVPLTTDTKTYNFQEDCKCEGEGCARCQAVLVLEKNGPATVYTKDLKSRDPKIKPVHDKIPLVKLGSNQKIKMELYAHMGTGKKHAKYHVANASYEQIDDSTFDFFVESYTDRTAKDIVTEAIELLTGKVSLFNTAFEEAKNPKKVVKKEKSTPKKEPTEETEKVVEAINKVAQVIEEEVEEGFKEIKEIKEGEKEE
jgi:hypothetical protein